VLGVVALLAVAACGGERAAGREKGSAGVANDGAATRVDTAAAAAAAGSGVAERSAAGPSTECTPRRLRALLVGTSLTAGYGLEPEQAYPALLQRMADSAGFEVEVVNAGLSGETSAAALRRADWIFRAPADVILIETGANDGLRALDPLATRENLRGILAKARAEHPEARLLLVQMEAPPNLGAGYTSRFHAVFPEVARESGATLVPFLLEGVAGEPSLNQGDGIHPNVAGSRRVAANLWPALEAALGALDPCAGRK
jgi:acyl-CoA thioesterase I